MEALFHLLPWLPVSEEGLIDWPLLGNVIAAGLMGLLALIMGASYLNNAQLSASRRVAHTLGVTPLRSAWTLGLKLPAPRLKAPPHRPFAERALSVEVQLPNPDFDIRTQFRVPPGRICALVGKEAHTQSALLQATAGLIDILGGRIASGQRAVYDGGIKLNRPAHERRYAWLDAQSKLFDHLSVKANLRYAMPRGETPQDLPDFEQVVSWLDLNTLLAHRPRQLSTEQRCRVALGRAMLARPQALLLDDPLGALPDADRAALLDRLADIPVKWRIPMVLVTPRMDEVIRLADDVLVLHEGRMASAGTVTQVLSDASLTTFLEGLNAGSVIDGVVRRHDLTWLLTEVDVGGQRISVPAVLHPVGSRVRIKLRARDLSLHKAPPQDSSALNHVHGRITQVMLAGEHGTYGAVGVDILQSLRTQADEHHGATHVWALLTRKAIQQMDWAPGMQCVVSFKAMATQVSAWR